MNRCIRFLVSSVFVTLISFESRAVQLSYGVYIFEKSRDTSSLFDNSAANIRPYASKCFNNIGDAIFDAVDGCRRSKCDTLNFVVLPCPDEFNTADVKRWSEFNSKLQEHYLNYDSNDQVGATDVDIRYSVYEWATNFWKNRQIINSADRYRDKILKIRDLLGQKINEDSVRKPINDDLLKIEKLKEIVSNYQSNSENLRKESHKFLEDFQTYKIDFKFYQDKLSSFPKRASENQNTLNSEFIGSVLYMQNEIQILELENRTKSLEIENRGEMLQKKMEDVLHKFHKEIEPYKDVLKNEDIGKGLDFGYLIEAVKKTKIYAIQRVSKFHDQSLKASDYIRKRADLMIQKLAAQDFNEGMKKSRLLLNSAEFLGKINKRVEFIYKETPSSGVFELPLLAQHYRNLNELIEFSKICSVKFDQTNSWMETGCKHLRSFVTKSQERITSLPEEIRNYLLIAKSVLENPKIDAVGTEIEKLLNENKLEKAVESYDALLIAYRSEKW